MPLSHNVDHLGQMRSRMMQYQARPRMDAVVQAFADEVQEVEDALWTLYFDRLLQNALAGGDLLDKIGKIVGQPRQGLADGEYRIFITARIAVNRSDGRRETLIRIAELLVPGAVIYFRDFPPGSVFVWPRAPIAIDPYVAALQFLQEAASAGVKLIFGWITSPISGSLMTGYSRGLGTTVPTVAQSPGYSLIGGIPGGNLGGAIGG